MVRLDLLNRFPSVVGRISFNKDELGPGAHGRGSSHGRLNIARLVSSRNNHRDARFVWSPIWQRPRHDEEGKTKRRKDRSKITIKQVLQPQKLNRTENPRLAPD